jgi:uncharacterized protein
MTFNADIFIIPGLGNSGEQHWQSIWEREYGFTRINQSEWDAPVKDTWIKTIDDALQNHYLSKVILVGHSLACSTIAFWAVKYNRIIKGALLVGPSDTEADTYPTGTTGFKPMPLNKLPFPAITVASADDYYVTINRAEYFAGCWGTKLVNIGNAGHINVASGYGNWDEGLKFLQELDT